MACRSRFELYRNAGRKRRSVKASASRTSRTDSDTCSAVLLGVLMQSDSAGNQEQSTKDQELKMDTSDDHDVERQLLGDIQPSPQEAAATISSSSNTGPPESTISGSQSTTFTSPEHSTDQIKVPLSEYELLCEAVRSDIYSSATWSALIEYSEQSRDLSKIKQTYDWLLDTYPNTVRFHLVLSCPRFFGMIFVFLHSRHTISVPRFESFVLASIRA